MVMMIMNERWWILSRSLSVNLNATPTNFGNFQAVYKSNAFSSNNIFFLILRVLSFTIILQLFQYVKSSWIN